MYILQIFIRSSAILWSATAAFPGKLASWTFVLIFFDCEMQNICRMSRCVTESGGKAKANVLSSEIIAESLKE